MGTISNKFIVGIPVANPTKFTKLGVTNNQRASFDQQRYSQVKNATMERHTYPQLWETADIMRVQFYTNYPMRRVRVLNCAGEEQLSYVPQIAVSYRFNKFRSDCRITSLNGKVFIYFEDGNQYSDENFEDIIEFLTQEGRLPRIQAEAGDEIKFKLNEEASFTTTTILEVVWNVAVQAEGYLTDIDSALLAPDDGKIEVTYNDKDTDLYYAEVDFTTLDPGTYYVRIEVGLSTYNNLYESEPIDLATEHEDSLAIEYRHNGDFSEDDLLSYVYLQDWKNILRVPATFCTIVPGGEADVYTDDYGIKTKSRAVPLRQLIFKALNVPSWIVDKFNMVFSHDTLIINGVEWESENFGTYETLERRDIGQYEITLTQKDDRSLYSDEQDLDVEAEFNPTTQEVPFEGDVFTVDFTSNTPEEFEFDSLPDWLSCDKDTFSDGDTLEFTVTANPSTLDRNFTLIARTQSFPALTAELVIHQLHDVDVEEGYIDIDSDPTVEFEQYGNQSLTLDVSSSGDYDIDSDGDFFTVTKQEGFSKIQIDVPSANNTSSNKEGTITLTLISDPSKIAAISIIQKDIDSSKELLSATPNSIDAVSSTQDYLVAIDVAALDVGWQAEADKSWISVSSAVQIGDKNFNIRVFKNTSGVARIGQVTFVNIGNPADTLTVEIVQAP